MEKTKELKLSNKVTKNTTEKHRMQLLMLTCMGYLISHLRNHDDYNFQNAWNSCSMMDKQAGYLLRHVDTRELDESIEPISDDETFEDIIRVGVQALAHACYPEEWENRIGQYLHPKKHAFEFRPMGARS